jgi:hypothetical protein
MGTGCGSTCGPRWSPAPPTADGALGRPLRLVGTLVDITARKEAELAAREREADQEFIAELGGALQSTTDPEALGTVG